MSNEHHARAVGLSIVAYPLVVVELLLGKVVGEAHPHIFPALAPFVDVAVPGDCRDNRDNLVGCLRPVPILACRSRSCRSDKFGPLHTVSKVPRHSCEVERTLLPHGRRRIRHFFVSSHCDEIV